MTVAGHDLCLAIITFTVDGFLPWRTANSVGNSAAVLANKDGHINGTLRILARAHSLSVRAGIRARLGAFSRDGDLAAGAADALAAGVDGTLGLGAGANRLTVRAEIRSPADALSIDGDLIRGAADAFAVVVDGALGLGARADSLSVRAGLGSPADTLSVEGDLTRGTALG